VYSDQVAAPDVGRMGIEILSFTIKVGKANILLQDIEVGG
jgi:hypothetical protein